MAWPRWKKRLAVALSIPVFMGAIGWIGLRIAEDRIQGEIDAELSKLEKLGVRPVLYRKSLDAHDDYKRIGSTIKVAWIGEIEDKEPSAIFEQIELASRKTFCGKPPPPSENFGDVPDGDGAVERIAGWLEAYERRLAKERDWSTLQSALAASDRLYYQTVLSGDGDLMFLGAPNDLPGTALLDGDRPTRDFLRRYLEGYSVRDRVAAHIGWLGRRFRLLLRPGAATAKTPAAAPKTDPWWLKYAERHGLFWEVADRDVVLAIGRCAETLLKAPYHIQDLQESLKRRLAEDDSWPAKWAGRRQMDLWPFDVPDDELARRLLLIQLDLLEAHDQGRPLKPTWSRSYCVDPGSGAPIKVKVIGGELTLSSSSSNGSYANTMPFPPSSPW